MLLSVESFQTCLQHRRSVPLNFVSGTCRTEAADECVCETTLVVLFVYEAVRNNLWKARVLVLQWALHRHTAAGGEQAGFVRLDVLMFFI